jgi:hypothetical protein
VHGRKALEIGMEEQTARVERMLNRYDMQKPLAARSCVGSRRRAVEYASGGSRAVSFCGLYVGYIGSQAPPFCSGAVQERPMHAFADPLRGRPSHSCP